MGLNEAAGYLAVALTAYLTGLIAARAGLRPEPFYLGLAYAGLGLGLSTLLVRETRGHAQLEAQLTDAERAADANPGPDQRAELRPAGSGCPPARSWSAPASASRPCRPAARPGWSTTSTTGSPGACCRCCSSAAASRSARSACSPRSIRPSGASANSSPARCPTGWAANPSSPPGCWCRPSRWPAPPWPAASCPGRPAPSCSGSAPPWSTRPCWPPSATSPTPAGAPPRSASTGCGATPASPSAPCSPAWSPTSPAWTPPSGSSPPSPPPPAWSSPCACTKPTHRHGRR